MNPQKEIEALKIKVAEQTELLTEQIRTICESLKYQDSSRFSYNIDRLEEFNRNLQEFEMLNK